MSEEAQKLLNMFIIDVYSESGKIKKKTAIAMIRYVEKYDELQYAVNNTDNKKIMEFKEP